MKLISASCERNTDSLSIQIAIVVIIDSYWLNRYLRCGRILLPYIYSVREHIWHTIIVSICICEEWIYLVPLCCAWICHYTKWATTTCWYSSRVLRPECCLVTFSYTIYTEVAGLANKCCEAKNISSIGYSKHCRKILPWSICWITLYLKDSTRNTSMSIFIPIKQLVWCSRCFSYPSISTAIAITWQISQTDFLWCHTSCSSVSRLVGCP